MPGDRHKKMLSDIFAKSSKKRKTPLSKEQVALLLHFCFCNAQDLFKEAELLRRHKKFARAFYLYAVALEELSKIPIALNGLFLPPDDQKAWEGFWKTFNAHGPKQQVAKLYGQRFIKTLNRERHERFYKSQIPSDIPLNDMKLASLYVDCYDGHPLRPTKLFGGAGSVASIAKIVAARVESFATLHSTLDKSIRFVDESQKHSIEVDGKDFKQIIIDKFRQRA